MSMHATDSHRLSAQQSSLLAPHWQDEAPATAVIAEGPGDARALDAFRAALRRQIARHEILRTLYRAVPGLRDPVQFTAPALEPAWMLLEATADEHTLLEMARSALDMQAGPVVAVAAAPVAPGRFKLALAAPSVALDIPSVQELLAACLSDADACEDAEVLQYPDYVAWQQDLLNGELGQEGARFWQAQIAPPLRMPFQAHGRGRRGPVETLVLGDAAVGELRALAGRLGRPEETVLAALWAGHLSRIGEQAQFAFEWRCGERPGELTGAIGCFDGLLPVAVQLDVAQPVQALIAHVAARLDAATSWHECFNAAGFLDGLALANAERPGAVFACAKALPLPAGWAVAALAADPGPARLRCEAVEIDGRWQLRWSGDDRQHGEMLRVWLRQFEALLEGIGRQPDTPWCRRTLLGDAERALILASAATPAPAVERVPTLHALFEAQVRQAPEAIAVICGGEQLRYGELDARAERLAGRLRTHGAGPERIVGVHLGRSVDAIVALLAVMKSGAAYVPLDPAYPAERIALMVDDARMVAVVVGPEGAAALADRQVRLLAIDDLADEPAAAPGPLPEYRGDHLAYLIYTSGSTGVPKGVMVSHANAVASTVARFAFYEERVTRFLLLSSFSFDSSVAGIFWTLGQGGTLCLPTEDAHRDAARVAALVAEYRISHLLALPSFYKQIAAEPVDAGSLRCVIVAGEACHADVVQQHRLRIPGATLVNEYGPTEGTVWSNAYRVPPEMVEGETVPIGRAIPAMRSLVLDDALEPCAIGLPGELYIGGPGITRGYRERPGLTAQRFIADPFMPGERLYRTSDRARLRPDGQIEYLGRADHQVKLRGHRIELGEIEALLRADARVREAVAFVHDDVEVGSRLMACVASQAEAAELQAALGMRLRERLPAFMVPSALVVLRTLPLMPNGKVDRQALQALGTAAQRPPFVAPRSETECVLADIWAEVLKMGQVGLDDNFFDLGGHSLLATQVSSRIRLRLAVDLPLRELFDAATLRDLATKVEAQLAASREELALLDDLLADAETTQ